MGIIGSAFLGYTRVFGAGENRFQPPITDGLLALYSPATENGYNGTNVIYDLSGNGKDLTISGGTHSQNVDGSIYFTTSSTAITSEDLSSTLNGTTAEMTVVFMGKNKDSWGGSGRWAIGPTSGWSGTNAVFEWSANLSVLSNTFGIGTKPVFSPGGGAWFYPWRYPYAGGVYGNKWDDPLGSVKWSFAAYTKANQEDTYIYPNSNLTLHTQGYYAKDDISGNQWFSGSLDKTQGTYTALGTPPSNGNWMVSSQDADNDNVLETNLSANRFFINGYADLALVDPGYVNKDFDFGGAAIFDRVLSDAEIAAVRDFYNEYFSFS